MVSKQEIVYFIAGILERGRLYSAKEISELILFSVHPRHLTDPRLAPDHLRLALVEDGFAVRDALASGYWLSDRYFGPSDEAELVLKVRELLNGDTDETIRCPACGKTTGIASLLGHVQSEHGSVHWLRLVPKYSS